MVLVWVPLPKRGYVPFLGVPGNSHSFDLKKFNDWLLLNFGYEKNITAKKSPPPPPRPLKTPSKKLELPHFHPKKKRSSHWFRTLDMTISKKHENKKGPWLQFSGTSTTPSAGFFRFPPSAPLIDRPPRYPYCERFVLDRHVARNAWRVDSNRWGCRSDA